MEKEKNDVHIRKPEIFYCRTKNILRYAKYEQYRGLPLSNYNFWHLLNFYLVWEKEIFSIV